MLSMASGDCKLLSTVALQSSQKTCVIPLDNLWLQKYKILILVCHIESNGTSGDWLYFNFNNSDYAVGQYTSFNPTIVKDAILSAFVDGAKITLTSPNSVGANKTYDINPSDNFLRFNLYNTGVNLIEGTTAKLYGIK